MMANGIFVAGGVNWYYSCYKEASMHKSAATLSGPLPETAPFGSLFRGLIAKTRNAVKIPTGYQDERGFHLGVKPPEKEIKWPSFW